MNEWLLSRRDRLIIARHEYVFSALLNRPGRPWYPIIPYPTGRFFRGTLSQALRARLRSVLSLRDALADISQQHLAKFVHVCGRSVRFGGKKLPNDLAQRHGFAGAFRTVPLS